MAQFIATVPNTGAGRAAINHIREEGAAMFGCSYVDSVSQWLGRDNPELKAPALLDQLPRTFHIIDIPEGQEKTAIPRILRHHADPTGTRARYGQVEALEPNRKLDLTAKLGSGFTPGGEHWNYMNMLNLGSARTGGAAQVKVAVIDTGSDSLSFVRDFYDLTSKAPTKHPGRWSQVDTNGHGTAMATLVHEVAPAARIEVIRLTEDDPEYLHLLAAVAVAAFDCQAEVVTLCLGFPDFGSTCGVRGTDAVSRSIALEKLLAGIIDIDPSRMPAGFLAPIYVAATGNDGLATGFDYPAAFDYTIAVGSVNSKGDRSSFSNYGTTHATYVVAPGGEDTPALREHVGSGTLADCMGTSVSTAYVAGMIALMRLDSRYGALSRDDLIDEVRGMCTVPSGGSALEYGSGVIAYK